MGSVTFSEWGCTSGLLVNLILLLHWTISTQNSAEINIFCVITIEAYKKETAEVTVHISISLLVLHEQEHSKKPQNNYTETFKYKTNIWYYPNWTVFTSCFIIVELMVKEYGLG